MIFEDEQLSNTTFLFPVVLTGHSIKWKEEMIPPNKGRKIVVAPLVKWLLKSTAQNRFTGVHWWNDYLRCSINFFLLWKYVFTFYDTKYVHHLVISSKLFFIKQTELKRAKIGREIFNCSLFVADLLILRIFLLKKKSRSDGKVLLSKSKCTLASIIQSNTFNDTPVAKQCNELYEQLIYVEESFC